MKSRKWFLVVVVGLVGFTMAAAAPHHPMPARPMGGMSRPGGAMPHPGAMPRPVAHPQVMHPSQSPFVGRPQMSFPGGHPGALTPQSQISRPPLNPVVSGNSGIRPLNTGPRPLVTNPHPNATRVTAARTTAAGQHHFVTPSGVAALSAASGKSPAEVALFLASQHGGWNHWGWGWGGWGWGWGGWWGSPGWGFWGINPFGLVPWGYGPGFSIGFGYHSGPWAFGLGYNFGYSPVMPYAPVFVGPPVGVVEANPQVLPQPEPVPPAAEAARPATTDFAQQGQELFLAGKYGDAVKVLRHAVVDDPHNGPLLALTGEALWAAGSYNEAAGAIQQSLLATPEADWTGVASRAARLIPAEAVGNLTRAIGEKETPDLRFLAGYQSFGAGKYDEAAVHLDLLLKKAPDDAVAKKLRDQAAKLAAGK
jgi:hypothetical protein